MGQQPLSTLPWTQASVDSLASAIALGVTEVRHEGKSVRYASLADMQRLLDRMIRTINAQGDGVAPVNFRPSVLIRR